MEVEQSKQLKYGLYDLILVKIGNTSQCIRICTLLIFNGLFSIIPWGFCLELFVWLWYGFFSRAQGSSKENLSGGKRKGKK